MARRYAFAVLLVAASACREKAQPDPAGAGSAAPGAAVTAVPSATEAPLDRSPIAVNVGNDLVRLHAVAHRPFDDSFGIGAQSSRAFRVHPFRDRMVVTQAGHVYTFDGAKLAPDPKAVTTEPVPGNTPPLGAYEIRRLEGTWPDALYVDAHFYSFMGPRQASYRDVSYRRANGSWEVVPKLPDAVAPWKGGVLLGLRDGKLDAGAGIPQGSVPALTPPAESPKCAGRASLLTPASMTALSTGEIFVVGQRCDSGSAAVERFAAGAPTGVIEDLPDAPKEISKAFISAGSDKNVFVALTTTDKPYVARFDGRAFRAIAIPDAGEVRAAWAPPDGSFFLVTHNTAQKKGTPTILVRFKPDGSITRFVAPRGARFRGLWARDAETAYTALDDDYGSASVLYSTKADVIFGSPPKELSDEAAPTGSDAPPADMGSLPMPPYTDACKTPFVFLYDVSPKAPPSFDFPTTRKALATFPRVSEITLVELVYEKKKRLGARVPSAEVGRELMKHVVDNMKDEAPELVCYEPKEGVREIKLR